MKCKQCGNELTADMLFCGECGCPVETAGFGERFCPQCGSRVNEGDMFCGECGCGLGVRAEEKASPPITETETAVPPDISAVSVERGAACSAADVHAPSSGTIKSTLHTRTERADDASAYGEGRKFLKIAADFD